MSHRRLKRLLLVLVVIAGVHLGSQNHDVPETYADVVEHFKYGSIGTEERAGLPYWIWKVLPSLFPEHLPQKPGDGYTRFGFIYESSTHLRPIGTTYRKRFVPLLGLNCAVCHTGRLRDTSDGASRFILGMPSHQLDFQAYFRFVVACARDRRFDAATLLAAIGKENPEFSWFDSFVYRFFVIPRTRQGILQQAQDFEWTETRPPQGPGRVDTFNPYKRMFGLDLKSDRSVGTADLPSLWNQKPRQGLWLHWDGNNNSVEERNKSAAIGAGASESSLDLPAMKRVEDWIWELKPPPFPESRIDRAKAEAGEKVFAQHCARCHDLRGEHVGQVTPIAEVGTDPERLNSFTEPLAAQMNTLGSGRPWKFSHFRKTQGYANMPLDGIWLRAPYLHNGSVPTLADLLKPPEQRPRQFYRGYDVYDFERMGFIADSAAAGQAGFLFDASRQGNSNQGHGYGTELPPGEKEKLLQFLKTL